MAFVGASCDDMSLSAIRRVQGDGNSYKFDNNYWVTCGDFSPTKNLYIYVVIEMSKLKHKNPKIKIEKLNGKKPKKNMFKIPIPINGFIEISDPNYELDDLPVDAVFVLER